MIVTPLHVRDVDERVRIALAFRNRLPLEEIRPGIADELGRNAGVRDPEDPPAAADDDEDEEDAADGHRFAHFRPARDIASTEVPMGNERNRSSAALGRGQHERHCVDDRPTGFEPELRRRRTHDAPPQPDRWHQPAEDVPDVLDVETGGLELGPQPSSRYRR